MRSRCRRKPGNRAAFTLLETLATLAVLLIILAALTQFLASVQQSWQSAAVDPFASAETAFEEIAHTLGKATLDPYQDYADANGAFRTSATATFMADHLARRSDLAFACGPASTLLCSSGRITVTTGIFFAIPAGQTQVYAQSGLNRLINAHGYFVEFGGDSAAPGFFTGPSLERWRLKEVAQPSESLGIFSANTSASWIASLTGTSATPSILAGNVVALLVLPERASADTAPAMATDYNYDSRDGTNALTFAQLPPRLRLVLVAIDEKSAALIAARYGATPPPLVSSSLFQAAASLDSDLAALDTSLQTAGITHRVFQQDIVVEASAWSNGSP